MECPAGVSAVAGVCEAPCSARQILCLGTPGSPTAEDLECQTLKGKKEALQKS